MSYQELHARAIGLCRRTLLHREGNAATPAALGEKALGESSSNVVANASRNGTAVSTASALIGETATERNAATCALANSNQEADDEQF